MVKTQCLWGQTQHAVTKPEQKQQVFPTGSWWSVSLSRELEPCMGKQQSSAHCPTAPGKQSVIMGLWLQYQQSASLLETKLSTCSQVMPLSQTLRSFYFAGLFDNKMNDIIACRMLKYSKYGPECRHGGPGDLGSNASLTECCRFESRSQLPFVALTISLPIS